MTAVSPAGSLRMVSGAVVWALHFMAIYVFAALACARGFADVRWWGVGVVPLAIGAATAVALFALIVIVVRALRGHWTTLRATRFGADSRLGAALRANARDSFNAQITAGVAALAGIAIVWETFPALMVPACK